MLESALQAASRYVKAVSAAVATFAATVGAVAADDSISLDEVSLLKAAGLAVLVALGVAVSPANKS